MDASRLTYRKLTDEEKADVRNFRGFQVGWPQIAQHLGMDADELQRQMLEQPQWKTPAAELDLFAEQRIDAVL